MNGFMDVKKETMEGINENLKEVPAIDSNAVCDTAEKFDEEVVLFSQPCCCFVVKCEWNGN